MLKRFVNRFDPHVTKVLEVALEVKFYKLNESQNAWEMTKIKKGPLFVYKTSRQPTYNIFLKDSVSDLNYVVEPVTEGFQVELVQNTVLYRNTKGFIYCIWFSNVEEYTRVAILFEMIGEHKSNGIITNASQYVCNTLQTKGSRRMREVTLKETPSRLPVILTPSTSLKVDLSVQPNKPAPWLTEEQLSQAVGYLLKNDADFGNRLYEAYVKSRADQG